MILLEYILLVGVIVCAVAAPYRAAFALEGAAIAGRKLLW